MAGDEGLLYGDELQSRKTEIQQLAVKQLLNTWRHARSRDNDLFLWGDEVECFLVRLNEENHVVELERPPWKQLKKVQDKDDDPPSLQPELGCYMLETTPSKPFGNDLQDLLKWQADLEKRRKLITNALSDDCSLLTLPYFPRLGATGRETSHKNAAIDTRNQITWSKLISDDDITANSRYKCILTNVVSKRGENIDILIPVYRDSLTPWPWTEPLSSSHQGFAARLKTRVAKENMIYMDSAMFGATACSLQVTMQGKNIEQARRLHDQLIPLGPVMLALTAGTPILRGYLANLDSRWPLFEQSVDDRNEAERAAGKPSRPRVSSSTTYIANDPLLKPEYQTPALEIDLDVKTSLMDAGMDDRLASHFAHIFDRDPLFASMQELEESDVSKSQIADSLLSNVYQLVRFKPPSDDQTGWRVEFRPMETQLSDFDNAAFCVFVILAARTILEYDLNLYVFLKDVEYNMDVAASMNAATQAKFVFRSSSIKDKNPAHQLMTATQIINGASPDQNGAFEGMIPLIQRYLSEHSGLDEKAQMQVQKYLQLVSDRASGKSPTTATWIRDFVRKHPGYNKDSVVSEALTWDLIQECIGKNGS